MVADGQFCSQAGCGIQRWAVYQSFLKLKLWIGGGYMYVWVIDTNQIVICALVITLWTWQGVRFPVENGITHGLYAQKYGSQFLVQFYTIMYLS